MNWILALPEIQELVLHHLDTEDRREAVLICKEFHKTICYLERNKCLQIDKQLIDSMMERKIFNSILTSRRQFSEIKINFSYPEVASAADLIVVVDKFNRHMKKFTVDGFPRNCRAEVLTTLLNKASHVEELSLNFSYTESQCCKFGLEKEFSNLKKLCINSVLDPIVILSKVPDHSLEGLEIHWLNEEYFQAFLNRQTKLKKLTVSNPPIINVDHLALEEMVVYDEIDDDELAALLKHQPSLRRLECATIGSAAFNELRRMRHFEVLIADISNSCTGELTNLKELTLDGFGFPNGVFRRVVFPKLVKFVKLHIVPSMGMEAEDFITLSRSSHNLQHIVFRNRDLSFLPTIIELFPELKTLIVISADIPIDESSDDEGSQDEVPDDEGSDEEDYFVPALSRQKLSMEEIVIKRWPARLPIGFLYDAINACPNLQRIRLSGLSCNENQVLGLIRSHTQLTHFRLNASSQGTSPLFSRPVDSTDTLHPVLVQIISIFRASADFRKLSFKNIADWGNQRIEDLLTDDADRTIVEKVIKTAGNCNLLLTKPKGRDPFEYFYR